jgi:uncharacterized protein YoxC
MKELRISEILLISDLEKTARRIKFHPQTTVIIGKNDTGKSAVLKSIYRTFGAEPPQIHPSWKNAEVTSLVRFSVEGTQYSILRKEGLIGLYDATDHVIGAFHSISNELAPVFANLVGFGLKLQSRGGELSTPPPAYFFLPYYIDQDKGWNDNWASFIRLSQFADYRRNVAEYHTGIRPNEYYAARGELQLLLQKLEKLSDEIRVLKQVQNRMQERTATTSFDLSLENFQAEIEDLLSEAQKLLKIEEDLKGDLERKISSRNQMDLQLQIVQRALSEVSADYRFATGELTEDSVDCPTCGAKYSNSFSERFEIAKDEERLQTFLMKLQDEKRQTENEIDKVRQKFDDNRIEVQKIRALLETKREKVTLAMILQSEGRKEVVGEFKVALEELNAKETKISEEADKYRSDLKALEDPDRIRQIQNAYLEFMGLYLSRLKVDRLGEASYRRIDSKIQESGSDQPRALLAYYFSILQVIRSFSSSSTICPIVIDSPNQQDQDSENLRTMLEFIRDNRPQNTQLILAVAEDLGVTFDGATINLQTRNSVLDEKEYIPVHDIIRPLIVQALEVATEGRKNSS